MKIGFLSAVPRTPVGPTALDVLQARYDGLERRFDALLEKYHALKVSGAVLEPDDTCRCDHTMVNELGRCRHGSVFMLTPAPAADDMKALIADKCGSNLKLRGIMLRQLAADRAARLDDDAIRHAIETGYESEGVPL